MVDHAHLMDSLVVIIVVLHLQVFLIVGAIPSTQGATAEAKPIAGHEVRAHAPRRLGTLQLV